MATTYPLATLAAQITSAGISAPDYADILASEIATEQSIFGSDILLTPDTQDYQRLAIKCVAIKDVNDLAIAVYNSFAPAYAQGVGLSALVQINGIQRETATYSTAVVNLVGQTGSIIPAGVIQDSNQNLWNLPQDLVFDLTGAMTVTATAQQSGAISAAAGSLNTIYTIVSGWQSVTNPLAAVPGAASETDAALRVRQGVSTTLPAQSPMTSIIAAVANTAGVGRYTGYENQTSTPDLNGVPGHSIAIVVEGGDVNLIATAIESKKAPGTGTFGTTSITVSDLNGIPVVINFFELTEVPIYVNVVIQPLTGFVTTTTTAIVNAITAFIAGLAIGQDVYYNWIFGPAGLTGSVLGTTFTVTSLTIGTSTGNVSTNNIPIIFNAAASCVAANVSVTVAG
jgi:uncharacterized phage protein gp47/JayE